MNCRDFETELLKAESLNGLSSEAKKHMDACMECNELYLTSERFFELVQDEKNTQVPPFLSTRVMAGIEKTVSYEKNFLFKFKPALQVAALFLILLSGFATAMLMDSNPGINDADLIYSDYFSHSAGLEMETSWFLKMD